MLGNDDKSLGYRPKEDQRKATVMSPIAEAQIEIRAAFPLARYGKLENVFYEAVRFISPRVVKEFTPRRARSIWEGTARRIDSDEMDALRAAKYEEARREQQELRARLAALDKKIAAFDAASSSASVAADRQRESRVG